MQTKTALTIIVSDCYDKNGQRQRHGQRWWAGDGHCFCFGRTRIECMQTKARREGWGEGARVNVSITVSSL